MYSEALRWQRSVTSRPQWIRMNEWQNFILHLPYRHIDRRQQATKCGPSNLRPLLITNDISKGSSVARPLTAGTPGYPKRPAPPTTLMWTSLIAVSLQVIVLKRQRDIG
jgi:hypothetical protein